MAEDSQLLEAKRQAQSFNVLDHRSSCKLFGRNALGTPIPTMIQIDKPGMGCDWGKPGNKFLMI
jgi:hypothetical protein